MVLHFGYYLTPETGRHVKIRIINGTDNYIRGCFITKLVVSLFEALAQTQVKNRASYKYTKSISHTQIKLLTM